jgi:endoglucanase
VVTAAVVLLAGAAPLGAAQKPVVRFAFTGDQRVREAWLAKVAQSGATVTARNESYNAKIAPGGTVTFGFNATTGGGANPSPGLVTVNGAPCSLT